jgi:hypothetical protein
MAPSCLHRWRTGIAAYAFGLVISASAFSAPWIVEGRVVSVSDGDTITVPDDAKAQTEPIGARFPETSRGPMPQKGQVWP